MNERNGLHPVLWLGAGAAGAWGVSRLLRKQARPRRPAASPPPAASIVEPRIASASAPSAPSAPSAVAATVGLPAGAPPAASVPKPAAPAAASAASLSRQFDFIFAAEGRGLPVAYLRALASAESSLRPQIDRGLFQIADVTRIDYGKRHGRDVPALALRDPRTNTAIAADTLVLIKASLARNHARSANAVEDWSNPRFVELLTLSWNAGWSESRGVGRVLDYLEDRGVFTATIDDIHASARAAGAVAWLHAYPARVRWARKVAAIYQAERERDAREGVA